MMQEFGTELLSMFFALVVVLLLAWLILRVIKRAQNGKSSDDTLRFVRALPVGSRERVVLIEYHGKEYMLGVTPGGINILEKRNAEPDKNITNLEDI